MSFLRDTVQMLLWRGVAIALGALTAIVVARWLGPSDRGVFALMVLWVGLAALVLQSGIPEASIYLIGSKQFPVVQVMSSVVAWLGAAAAVGAVTCLAICLATGMTLVTAVMLAIVLALLVLTTAFRHFLIAQGRFGRYSISVVIEAASNLVVLSLLHRMHRLNVELAVAGYLAGLVAALFLLMKWLPRGELALGRRHVRIEVIATGARHGIHLFITGIGAFGVQRIGYVLLDWLAGVRSVGLFAAASALPVLFSNLPQQLATVLYSHVSASGAERGARLAAAVFQLLAVAGLLLLVPLYMAKDAIALILFGREFEGIGSAIAILAGAMLMTGLNGILYNALAGTGSARVGGWLTALSLSVMTILGCLLIPSRGLIGAAWAQFGAAGLSLAVVILLFCRRLGVPARVLLVPALAEIRAVLSPSQSRSGE